MAEYKYDAEVEERLRKPLEAIIGLPEEERLEVFWRTVGNKRERDEVKLLLYRAHNEKFFNDIMNQKWQDEITSSGHHKNQFVLEVWEKSFKLTIMEFEFDTVSFMRRLKQNYKNEYINAKRVWELEQKTGNLGFSKESKSGKVSDGRKKKLSILYKLWEKEEKIISSIREVHSQEELNELVKSKLVEKNKEWKSYLDEVQKLRNRNRVSAYADGGDGTELNLMDTISYEEDEVSFGQNPETYLLREENNAEKSLSLAYWLEEITEEFSCLTVELRECYRAFFTRDILVNLKLKNITQPEEEEEKYYYGCKGKCRYTDGSCAAGNEDIYDVLSENEYFFMENLFHEEYIRTAIEPKTESLDELFGIYYNLLKREFKFSDKVIAEVLNLTKQTLSRRWNDYQTFQKKVYAS